MRTLYKNIKLFLLTLHWDMIVHGIYSALQITASESEKRRKIGNTF